MTRIRKIEIGQDQQRFKSMIDQKNGRENQMSFDSRAGNNFLSVVAPEDNPASRSASSRQIGSLDSQTPRKSADTFISSQTTSTAMSAQTTDKKYTSRGLDDINVIDELDEDEVSNRVSERKATNA